MTLDKLLIRLTALRSHFGGEIRIEVRGVEGAWSDVGSTVEHTGTVTVSPSIRIGCREDDDEWKAEAVEGTR